MEWTFESKLRYMGCSATPDSLPTWNCQFNQQTVHLGSSQTKKITADQRQVQDEGFKLGNVWCNNSVQTLRPDFN